MTQAGLHNINRRAGKMFRAEIENCGNLISGTGCNTDRGWRLTHRNMKTSSGFFGDRYGLLPGKVLLHVCARLNMTEGGQC